MQPQQYICTSDAVPDAAGSLLQAWAHQDVRNATVAGTYPIVDWEVYNEL